MHRVDIEPWILEDIQRLRELSHRTIDEIKWLRVLQSYVDMVKKHNKGLK